MSREITTHRIDLGGRSVRYSVKRSRRSSLSITVFPDGSVFALAPAGADIEAIERRLRKRGRWILSTIREFEHFKPVTPERRFLPGETHRYLGRQYRILVEQGLQSEVSIAGDRIAVRYPGTHDAGRTADLLQLWYQRQARKTLGDRLSECLQHFPEIRKSPKLTVRKLTKRWGSMSPNGDHMLLNTRLIEAPTDCIDYVIIHELCHVQERHHGPAFFELLERKLPNWEKRKLRLERMMV